MHMDRCLFCFWEHRYILEICHRKEWVHMHFVSERSTPKKGHLRESIAIKFYLKSQWSGKNATLDLGADQFRGNILFQ